MTRGLRALVGTCGELVIRALIRVCGRRYAPAEVAWLIGPTGGATIGDRPYDEVARAERLSIERLSTTGGLIPDFTVLASPGFDPDAVDPRIREFYEHTARYRFDTWSTTYYPGRLGLWLLVTTISRRVQQLDLPLDGMDTARGVTSEIILLRDASGVVRYTGWFRQRVQDGRVLFTGFYMTQRTPTGDVPCVKAVFPMPDGNATVVLRPVNDGTGFRLTSAGTGSGDAGFYRLHRTGDDVRIWRVGRLLDAFHLYVDREGCVRGDHEIRFWGIPIITLHYRIMRRDIDSVSAAIPVSR
ncbi:MAG TPA: hypothetical protein VMF13_06505 [Luteitalea sp.]|nr:hypothetical protein [Luteitalea sp.]